MRRRGECQRRQAAPRLRPVSRADIALTDNAVPTISAGPSSAMFASARPVSGVQSIAATFKDPGGGVAATGIQVDGQTVSETPVANAALPHALPAARAVPADARRDAAVQPRQRARRPAHQLRVFARDATGDQRRLLGELPVTTSARGAINGTNGSDQAKLTVGVRRAVSAGHRAPTPHTTLDVPYNAKTVAQGAWSTAPASPSPGPASRSPPRSTAACRPTPTCPPT